jgi:hypothetical protein
MAARGPAADDRHDCPLRRCPVTVPPERLMCRMHWYQVPKPLRDAVWATWRSGAGAGTPAHGAAIAAAVRAVEARLADSG